MPPFTPPKKKKTIKERVDNAIIAGGAFLNDPSGKNRAAQANREALIEQSRIDATAAQEPTTKTEEPPKVEVKPKVPEAIRGEGGKITGVNLPDGTSFLGVPEATALAILNRNAGAQLPQGTQPAGTARKQAEFQQQQQQNQALLEQGQQQQLGQVQGASPDIGQALGAGAIGAIPGVIGGAITGAIAGGTAGTIALPGIGTVSGITAGAIGGAIATFLTSVRSNLAQQQGDAFAADQQALIKGDRYLRSLITDTNRNPQNAPQNIALFYQTLNMIDAAHQKSWIDSQENLNRFLGKDGTRELAKFEVFDATMRNYYLTQFQTALGAPNPSVNLITLEELQGEFDE